jgi:hypothetical protein
MPKMGCKRIASYSKRNAFSKKRKHTALKAIETNFNDPAIEKAIRRMPTKKKRRSQLPHCLRSQEVGSQKLPSMSKKTNTNILKGLGVILGQRSKISPETYANELLFAGSSYFQASLSGHLFSGKLKDSFRPIWQVSLMPLVVQSIILPMRPRIVRASSSLEQGTSEVSSELKRSLEDPFSDDNNLSKNQTTED